MFVSGCKTSGVYGNSCQERCPTHCRDNVCHIQRGTCFGCKPGWTGTTCMTRMIGIKKKIVCRCMQTSLDILGDVSGNKNRVNCLFTKEKFRGFHQKTEYAFFLFNIQF